MTSSLGGEQRVVGIGASAAFLADDNEDDNDDGNAEHDGEPDEEPLDAELVARAARWSRRRNRLGRRWLSRVRCCDDRCRVARCPSRASGVSLSGRRVRRLLSRRLWSTMGGLSGRRTRTGSVVSTRRRRCSV